MSRTVAAIDFGTNTARLLVAELGNKGFQPIALERRIVRMGGGFSVDVGLSEDACQRGFACLKFFAEVIEKFGVTEVKAVATSAVRDAVNGHDFIEAVRLKTGIKLQIIDGEQEGKLTFAGVMTGLDFTDKNMLLFDVGGGSTEYTIVESAKALFISSLPIGVVRLTEGKIRPEAITEKIRRELAKLLDQLETAQYKIQPGSILVGCAGTATTLSAINMKMKDYDYRKVNNSILTLKEIRAIYNFLLPMNLSERLSVAGLEKGREDLIIAGILITIETMELFGFETMKVSDYGLLEGLLISALQ